MIRMPEGLDASSLTCNYLILLALYYLVSVGTFIDITNNFI